MLSKLTSKIETNTSTLTKKFQATWLGKLTKEEKQTRQAHQKEKYNEKV